MYVWIWGSRRGLSCVLIDETKTYLTIPLMTCGFSRAHRGDKRPLLLLRGGTILRQQTSASTIGLYGEEWPTAGGHNNGPIVSLMCTSIMPIYTYTVDFRTWQFFLFILFFLIFIALLDPGIFGVKSTCQICAALSCFAVKGSRAPTKPNKEPLDLSQIRLEYCANIGFWIRN